MPGRVGALEPARRRRNAIAGWLRARGIASPGARRIEQIAREVVGARFGCDAVCEARRHRSPALSESHPVGPANEPGRRTGRAWLADSETLTLDHGYLAWEPCTGGGLDNTVRDTEILVRLRGDGARGGCDRCACEGIRSRNGFSRWEFRRGSVGVSRWCTPAVCSPRSEPCGSTRGSPRRRDLLGGGWCGLLGPDHRFHPGLALAS